MSPHPSYSFPKRVLYSDELLHFLELEFVGLFSLGRSKPAKVHRTICMYLQDFLSMVAVLGFYIQAKSSPIPTRNGACVFTEREVCDSQEPLDRTVTWKN